MQAELFELLKTILKARGMTYADLASRLGVSEPTIKRIFSERDCKLSRMTEICSVLDLSLDDLVQEANRVHVAPVELGDSIEGQLAMDRSAFHLFLLLLDGMSFAAICEHYEIPDTRVFELGLRLERMGLAEVMPGNRIRLTVQGPIHFRRDGPLHRRLLQLNLDFLLGAFHAQDTDHSAYLTQSRRMTRQSAEHILARLREIQLEVSNLARRDQLTQPDAALQSYKLGIAIAPIDFPELLSLADD
ncbi:helix-turn-helix domain-containing protein [Dinoroseobacter sp. S76]|uniref:helix-turn-helix domain-containing protein n=1 Tax=Dinoroseobacter sp. S76 TaxID=3415124 RepID=UPI003C7CAE40